MTGAVCFLGVRERDLQRTNMARIGGEIHPVMKSRELTVATVCRCLLEPTTDETPSAAESARSCRDPGAPQTGRGKRSCADWREKSPRGRRQRVCTRSLTTGFADERLGPQPREVACFPRQKCAGAGCSTVFALLPGDCCVLALIRDQPCRQNRQRVRAFLRT